MAQFTLERDIRSLVLEKSELNKLLELLSKVVEEDNGESDYRRELDMSINYRDGLNVKTNNTDEFLNLLELDRKIRVLDIDYFGNNVRFHLRSSNNLEIGLTIRSINKERVLGLEDDISKILKNNNPNGWIYSRWSLLGHQLLFMAIIFILLRTGLNYFKVSNTVIAVVGISLFLSWPVSAIADLIIPKIYPRFVLKDEKLKTGRIFKEDAKGIIISIVTLVVVPIIISIFF